MLFSLLFKIFIHFSSSSTLCKTKTMVLVHTDSLGTIHRPLCRSDNWFRSSLPLLHPSLSPPATGGGSWAGPGRAGLTHSPSLYNRLSCLNHCPVPNPANPGPRLPVSPLLTTLSSLGPLKEGRELRWPHYADCSSASARYIPENWARLLRALPLCSFSPICPLISFISPNSCAVYCHRALMASPFFFVLHVQTAIHL